MVERVAMTGRLAQRQRRGVVPAELEIVRQLSRHCPCRAFTCRRYAADLEENDAPDDTGIGPQGLKSPLCCTRDAALKGPLFHGTAGIYGTFNIHGSITITAGST